MILCVSSFKHDLGKRRKLKLYRLLSTSHSKPFHLLLATEGAALPRYDIVNIRTGYTYG